MIGAPSGRRPSAGGTAITRSEKNKQPLDPELFVFSDLVITVRAKRGPMARQQVSAALAAVQCGVCRGFLSAAQRVSQCSPFSLLLFSFGQRVSGCCSRQHQSPLLSRQREHGIDLRDSPRRQETGDQAGHRQCRDNRSEHHPIARIDVIEHGLQRTRRK